jgi:uncharacterized membrane protein (DUF485 family)
MNKKKIYEWIYRIILFTITHSLIVCVSFVALYVPLTVLKPEQITFGVRIGLMQAAFASSFIQIANLFYWLNGINLLNFKELFK